MKFLLGEFFASDEPEQKFCRHTAKLILRMGNGRENTGQRVYTCQLYAHQPVCLPCRFKNSLDILAAALNTPISVMETAGEGRAWGMALLASYMVHKKDGETLYKRTFH